MPLWLVRHARPLVAEGTVYGATDLPADAAHTAHCAAELARMLPQSLVLHGSPLRRCTQLQAALRALRPDLQAGAGADPRLAEMDFGHWEGWRWSDVPRAAMDAWTADFARHRFGGAESVRMLMQRVAAALVDTAQAGQPAVWITHMGVIRAVRLIAAGQDDIEQASQWQGERVDFGAACRVGLDTGRLLHPPPIPGR